MQRIADVAQQPLRWKQPNALKQEHELRTGDALVATLKFRSLWGTFATAESADGCWTFKRTGFWKPRASIRVCEAEVDLAEFQNNTWTNGGTLTFGDDRRFKATTNFWETNYEFRTVADEPLVRFKHSGVVRLSAEVKIFPAGRELAELPLLVLFGWYVAIMLYRDSLLAMGASGAVVAGG